MASDAGRSGRIEEFWNNVWDHGVDEFQKQFDERRSLTDEELTRLAQLQKCLADDGDDTRVSIALYGLVNRDVKYFELLIQLTGFTRGKLLSDFNASAAARKLGKHSTSHTALLSRENWDIVGPTLVSRLRKTVGALDLVSSAEALNQATWPSYIRQERAKRSGHEAEYRLAILMHAARVPFAPIEKMDQPLCADAQIHGVSFDLVVPSTTAPLVVFKATVHTANIGQYGESKDALEVREAQQMLADKGIKAILFALIDGAGFKSNRDGLTQVLANADEFCQFDTIWKAAFCCASVTRTPLLVELPAEDIAEHAEFIGRYSTGTARIVDKAERHAAHTRVPAGRGAILIGAA